jgi:hypothetical protein
MLTDTLIRKTKTPAKPTKLADERGLFLLLAPSGGRWWRSKYRYAGKEKLLSLGTYPDVSLANARVARDEARRTLAQGTDPSAERQQDKRQKADAAANDFATVAREWLENVKPKWAPVYHGDTLKRCISCSRHLGAAGGASSIAMPAKRSCCPWAPIRTFL